MAQTFNYRNRGTCSSGVTFTITDEGTLSEVSFIGGCSGNTQGVARLAEGMKAEEYVKRCKGIRCGMKSTSCPDQLACAVEDALAKLGN